MKLQYAGARADSELSALESERKPQKEPMALVAVSHLYKGMLLLDPRTCVDGPEIFHLLNEHDFPVSVAYVEGYDEPVLDALDGERIVGAPAIREFLARYSQSN
jgi:hypothetical protein